MDLLWERSPSATSRKVKTPTLFIHGENDNDVPIAEAEQFYIALKDVGVETMMVRYPREGHGLRETKHVVDVHRPLDRVVRPAFPRCPGAYHGASARARTGPRDPSPACATTGGQIAAHRRTPRRSVRQSTALLGQRLHAFE